MRITWRWMWISIILWASCPGSAGAHLVNSGLGPFYDGVGHLFMTPVDLMLVLAVALLAGQRGNSAGRLVLGLLPLSWLAGLFVSSKFAIIAFPAVNAAILIGMGLLVAANVHLSGRFIAVADVVCGMFFGWIDGSECATNDAMNSGNGLSLLFALGIISAVFLLVALVSGQVSALRKEWAKVVVRVAGSWIGAIGLLLFGWTMR